MELLAVEYALFGIKSEQKRKENADAVAAVGGAASSCDGAEGSGGDRGNVEGNYGDKRTFDMLMASISDEEEHIEDPYED